MSIAECALMIRVPAMMAIILYWCCDKDENRLKIAIPYFGGQALQFYFVYQANQSHLLAMAGALSVINTAYNILYSLCFTRGGFRTCVKQAFGFVMANICFLFIGIMETICLPGMSSMQKSQMDVDCVFAWPVGTLLCMIPVFWAVKKRLFERIPFVVAAVCAISVWFFDFVGSILLCIKQVDAVFKIYYFLMSLFLGCICSWGFLWVRRKKYQMRQTSCQELLSGQLAFYERLKEQESLMRRLRHDAANHL